MRRFGSQPTVFIVALVATVLVLCTLAPPPAHAADDKKAEDKKNDTAKPTAPAAAKTVSPYAAAARAARERKTGGVITNEDLQHRYTGSEGFSSFNEDPAAGPVEVPDRSRDYVATLNEEQASRSNARARAQAEVEAARRTVERLEKQLLALKNPFAARAAVSDEEREARAKDASVTASIARTEQELAAARTALAVAERRTAGGTPPPAAPKPAAEPAPAKEAQR